MSILTFHGIGTPHDGVDSNEARYWICAERFGKVLDRVADYQRRDRKILLAFDDGNRSDITIGVPGLRARNLTAHFFMLTGRCDNPRHLNAGDIRALAAGEMRVGLHGRDHLDWRRLGSEALDFDIRDSRKDLVEITGQPVDSVAIPFGGYNRRVSKYLKGLGFAEIYTSDGSHTSVRRRLRHRLSIRKDMTDAEVDSFLAGSPVHWRSRLMRGTKSCLKEHII